MLEDKQIKELNETEMKNIEINCYSCIKENGKKIICLRYDIIKEVYNAINSIN